MSTKFDYGKLSDDAKENVLRFTSEYSLTDVKKKYIEYAKQEINNQDMEIDNIDYSDFKFNLHFDEITGSSYLNNDWLYETEKDLTISLDFLKTWISINESLY